MSESAASAGATGSTSEATAIQGTKDGLGSTVAEHYNKLEEVGLSARTQSRIFYMRNLNNWIKSMAISDALGRLREKKGRDADISVLDLCSGKGGDLLKWKKGNVNKVVCVDIADKSVEQSENRYKDLLARDRNQRYREKVFDAEFYVADVTKKCLMEIYKNPNMKFELVSCQFAFHYSFESYQQADMILRNSCESITPGGYFLGTIPDSYEIMKRLRKSNGNKFGNEVFSITFESEDKENVPLFGAKYKFHLEEVVDCPEFLVYFPVLEKMAAKYNMKLVYRKPFAEFINEQLRAGEGRGLIGRMQALEPYPADEDVKLLANDLESYKHAAEKHKELVEREDNRRDDDGRPRKPMKVGTLSSPEWEATTIYQVFLFQKMAPGDMETMGPTEEKRPRMSEDNS